MTAEGAVLEASDVRKSYSVRTREGKRELVAVDGVSLRIRPGQTVGLVGESGCGKSTTGRLLLNLEEPTAGSVKFDGQDLVNLTASQMRGLRRHVQMIFQDPYASLNGRMTIRQLLSEPFQVHGLHKARDMDKEIVALLDLVGLGPHLADRLPRQLSGGQRQRVSIARAVALRPRFVVCDEPVSALDVSVQAQIINLLRSLQRELGLTYLFISHDLSVVRYLCDETTVMYLGQVVESAPTAELFTNPRHPYTQTLMSAIPVPDPRAVTGSRVIPSGEVPSPLDRPSGCPFRTRCPLAAEVCARERPPLRDLGGGHEVACHFAETANLVSTS